MTRQNSSLGTYIKPNVPSNSGVAGNGPGEQWRNNPGQFNSTRRTDAEMANTKRLREKAALRFGDGSVDGNRDYLNGMWQRHEDEGGRGSRMMIDEFGNFTGYERYGLEPAPTPDPTGPSGPSGPSAADRRWAQYQQAIMAMANSIQPANVGAAPQDLLSPLVNAGVDSSKAASAASYGGVGDLTSNAYEDMQIMDAPQFDPQIAKFLDAQGMGTDYASAAQMQGQQGLDGANSLFTNQKNVLSANQNQYNDARNADVDELAANSAARMESERTALLGEALMRFQGENKEYDTNTLQAEYLAEQQKRELLMSLLDTGFQNGQDMSGIDIFKLLGGM